MDRTDVLDSAGNTTAAIGKGFAIGAAILTSLALFAAFLTRADHLMKEQDPTSDLLGSINLLDPMVFSGLFIGAVLPALFTAMTMKSVGAAAFKMIEEVRRQFRDDAGIMEGTSDPDYAQCVAISTQAAIKEMVAPGVLIMGAPLVTGFLFGIQATAGLLAGSLVAGGVLAISASNSWRRLGQCQEIYRSRQSRWQGHRESQGGGSWRYGGRSPEGHLRPIAEHPDQAVSHPVARIRTVLRTVRRHPAEVHVRTTFLSE